MTTIRLPATGDAVRENSAAGRAPALVERLPLRINFAWTLIGNVTYSACQWGMLVVLAKLGSAATVGLFALALAITGPVFEFSSLHLRGVQATDARREYRFGDYVALRLGTSTLALLATGIILLAIGYGGRTFLVVLAMGLAKAFDSMSDVVYGAAQQRERMDRIAVSMIAKGVLALVTLGACMYLTSSLVWAVGGLALSWATIFVVYDLRTAAMVVGDRPGRSAGVSLFSRLRVLEPIWHITTLRRLAWLALPLGVVFVLNSLYVNVPRYFVEHYFGTRQLGIFAAIAYLLVAGSTVINALGDSASPRLSKYFAAGDRQAFRSLLFKLVGFGAAVGMLGVLLSLVAGRWILTILYRPEYGAHVNVLVWMAVASSVSFVSSFLGFGMTAARHFRVQAPLTAVVLALTAAGCAVLVPRYGLVGAAWSILFALLFKVLAGSVVLTRILRRQAQP